VKPKEKIMNHTLKLHGLIVVLSLLLASCSPRTVVSVSTQEIVKKETVVVQGTSQIIEKVVTTTPVPVDKSGGIFTWGIPAEPPGFNPILNDNYTELYVFGLDSEPLTWGGENYPSTLTPILAKSWETSSDGLTWTIHLREGVKWSDGIDFTADDVLYWAKAIQDPETKGAEWLKPRFYTGNDPYIFEKVDDLTVKITTKEPVHNLLNLIVAPLIPAHYFIENNVSNGDMMNDRFNTDGNIGTGPFKIDEYRRGEAVILSGNDLYWRGKPYLDQVVMKVIPDTQAMVTALQTGEVDWAQVDPSTISQLVSNPDLKVNILKLDSERNIYVNVKKPMLKDIRTRQAIMYALDRMAIIRTQDLGYGDLADNIYTPYVTAYEHLPQYEFNVDKAKQLLSDVGWIPGDDGILKADHVDGVPQGTRFSINYVYYLSSDQIPTVVQSNLKDVGIEVTQVFQDQATFNSLNLGTEDKTFDLTTGGFGWLGSDAGAYGWLYAAGNAADTYTNYFSPELQALFDKAKVSKDESEADVNYKKVAQMIWDELPIIPLYYRQWIFVSNMRVHLEEAEINPSLFGLFAKPEKIWVEK
jgi:peptide/nickel transport system substrate-binding protein